MSYAPRRIPAHAPRNLVEIDLAPRQGSLREEVLRGLTAIPKALPPKLFYDARGAELFRRICATPAYYPTRTETGILQAAAPEIAAAIGQGAALVEPGAGEMRKIRSLLPHLRPVSYMPIDIAIDQLREEARRLALEHPWLRVIAVAAEFDAPALREVIDPGARRQVLFFPGSTIGNFEPDQAETFLHTASELVGPDGAVLLGVDLVKPTPILDRAYNDPEGYTARFNLNLLVRLNRELNAQFDLCAFDHRAFYAEAAGRIEMHLVSRRAQAVRVAGQVVAFAAGETIHTENSYKYSPDQVAAMARRAGYRDLQSWHDPAGWFGVFLLRGGAGRRRQ
jgi:dimethylhistidine N-methyltransferase